MDKKIIKEINSIRSIACLCVVFLHAIQERLFSWESNDTLHTILGLLAYGTTTFIFLSELVLSRSYPDRLPERFFKKRVIPLLVPFIVMCFFYAFIGNYNDFPNVLRSFGLNLIGNYQGPWFILVIFQFYALHQLFVKYLRKIPAVFVLAGSFILNETYLAVFNLIDPPSKTGFMAYLWGFGYWVPCFGWLFYFSLAYYCGKNYERFIQYLKSRSILVLTAPIVGAALIVYVDTFHAMPYGSKRMDMVPFATAMILALFLILSRLKKQPALLEFISQYTFGIYLIHLFFIRATYKTLHYIGLDFGYFEIPVMFLSAAIASIIAVHVLNKLPYGRYLIGGLRSAKRMEPIKPEDIPLKRGYIDAR